jgi:cytochrome c biogenesis protein ResB
VLGHVTWRLASLKLTLVFLLLLGAGIVLTYQDRTAMTWPLAIPLFALALNLIAAVATNPLFRRQTPLLLFHLALIGLMVLAGFGRLTYLKARVEVTEGQAFDGVPVEVQQGPFHSSRLERVRFVNERFVIDYSPEVTIRATANLVRWQDPSGRWRSTTITENVPLSVLGYRFYVTNGKGFAPVFAWRPRESREWAVGSVHLPKFPSDDHAQQAEWTLPDGKTSVWVRLLFDRPVLAPGEASRLTAPADSRIVLRHARQGQPEDRYELRPGQSVALAGGVLEYKELRLWMGYLVYYDWTVPWLLATSALAVIALAWHFIAKFKTRPW